MIKYKISDKIATTSVDECLIILNLDTSVYYILERTACFIFECIQNGQQTIEGITDNICANYDIKYNEAYNDTKAFLDSCLEQGIIFIEE